MITFSQHLEYEMLRKFILTVCNELDDSGKKICVINISKNEQGLIDDVNKSLDLTRGSFKNIYKKIIDTGPSIMVTKEYNNINKSIEKFGYTEKYNSFLNDCSYKLLRKIGLEDR